MSNDESDVKTLKLQRIRVDKGFTLRTLADEIGVHFSLISYWEHGIKKPRIANQLKLEKALDTPASTLFEEDDLE